VKIFWSWQSDTPGKTGRFLIRDALKDAVGRLKQSPEIDEPVREALHLDQDIQDVPGAPDLARTILSKIDASDVVVADVTLVGNVVASTDTGKKLINSNVAIELGYALHALSDQKVVLVFNRHYGGHEDLPFDLRHKGGAIVFDVTPDANREHIDEERKKLTDRFVNALKPYVQTAAPAAPSFNGAPSTFSRAAYFAKDEVLGRVGEFDPANQIAYSYDTDALCYLRLIPTVGRPEPIPLSTLKRTAQFAPMMHGDGAVTDLNNHGAIRIVPGTFPRAGSASIRASTQVFETGEIWSIDAGLIKTKESPIGTPPFVHSVAVEQSYYDTLKSLVGFATKQLSINPPWQVELGLLGPKNLNLGIIGFDRLVYERRMLKNEIIYNAILRRAEGSEFEQLLLPFFSKIHDATGIERPRSYCGFPPGRPGSI
jgi:hypothetical protein